MEPFSVIAADPGGTTGIAEATYDGESELTIPNLNICTYELGPDEHHMDLYNILTDWFVYDLYSHVITESFEFRQNLDKRKVELISKEYIGIFKLFARTNGLVYFERNASQAKSFVSDIKLDALGILEVPKHPNRHRNDALRHLIMYLVVNLRIQSPITDKWRG